METLQAIENVDTERFMGDWFVIAHIPPFLTRNAFNAVECYELREDDRVDVRFTYRNGGFDSDLKKLTPTGFPEHGDEDGAWGMRFVWPFKADYRIVYLDDDYTETIIGREKRDYVWIMARTPLIEEIRYRALVQRVSDMGYDPSELRKVPQQPMSLRESS